MGKSSKLGRVFYLIGTIITVAMFAIIIYNFIQDAP
jgi:hypothetical protein